MQPFYWLVLVIVIGIAIFVVQNSAIPLIPIKFLVWKFETSLIYTILGSIAAGIFMTLIVWIPRAVKTSIRLNKLRKEKESLEKVLQRPDPMGEEKK